MGKKIKTFIVTALIEWAKADTEVTTFPYDNAEDAQAKVLELTNGFKEWCQSHDTAITTERNGLHVLLADDFDNVFSCWVDICPMTLTKEI